MSQSMERPGDPGQSHSHVFLGEGHEANERKTWAVIILCGIMMLVEIVGGSLFGSLALIADGLHMSTHAGAMLIAALAYTYARRHATDNRFVFGTGKLGDLAGFTSAIVLAIIALLIGYEAIERFIDPVGISFNEAIPIAVVGLVVNIVSAWLLSDGDHPGHSHSHGGHSHGEGMRYREVAAEMRAPFRADAHQHAAHDHSGDYDHGGHDHAHGHGGDHDHHGHDHDHSDGHTHVAAHPLAATHAGTPAQATTRDNSIRSAYAHVLADAFVSVLAITGLILAKVYGWLWMDPLAGIIGALVIANWSVTLIRDTAGILLDVCPDEGTRERVRRTIEIDGDRVVDLHLWRLGPGHLAAVLAIATSKQRDASFYRGRLSSFACLSHITVEVTRAGGP
ncbi:MAG TPA: CDF family Co(II)/Ni(II) efflux transporter DmeF [Steroidobacteraceae bacterium]|nr:CDF family Co(II)/Ni(II) efflux transporter DmeF [Steroidobacteraceae bacterium]